MRMFLIAISMTMDFFLTGNYSPICSIVAFNCLKAGATSLNQCRCLRPDGTSLVVDVVLLDGVGDEQLVK